MKTDWDLPCGDETLQVYAHATPGDPTSIGFRHWGSHYKYRIQRRVNDESGRLRWMVQNEAGHYQEQPPDYQAEGWPPDPGGQVVLDLVYALTSEELLEIAQSLADDEVEDARDLTENRVELVQRAKYELAEAESRLHLAHLIQDALQQTARRMRGRPQARARLHRHRRRAARRRRRPCRSRQRSPHQDPKRTRATQPTKQGEAMTSTVPDQVADHWHLPPFSDIRCLDLYDEHVRTYQAFLAFIYEGRAAVARLPLVISTKTVDIWQRLDDTIRTVLDLLAQLDLEQRVRFHREIDETVDLYFRLYTLRADG